MLAKEGAGSEWGFIIETEASSGFTVDLQEGTVAGPGGTVRLEPKVMGVLHLLSRHAGRVVSRDELMATVWPDVIVTEHTLSRCIYQLRSQLGKIADDPDQSLIETLPKRGYRLLAGVATVSAAAPAATARPTLPLIPYVVGQWVRGDRFYGREVQIAEILDGPRNCIWLLGTRRIGKTSLLKQLEQIADTEPEPRYFPLFWDFQGVATRGELHVNFTDAVLDAEERLERIGIPLQDVVADDLFVSLERLRRRMRGKELGLLLLCDEVEELVGLRKEDPTLLRKLRHAMQSRDDIRTVLASTMRLWTLADEREDTSPFLHGFAPPLYIERLSSDEARSLIEQSHLAPEQRPSLDEGAVETIQACCDNHPYLMQLVCKRYVESGDLGDAIEQVGTDRMVSYFFSVDFDMLSDDEQDVIRRIASGDAVTSDAINSELDLHGDTLADMLRRLRSLGFIRGDETGAFRIANDFFRRWLQDGQGQHAARTLPVSQPDVHDAALPDPPAPRGEFFAELKRRKVFRVGAAYILVAWLLLQLGDTLFELLDVPGWAGRLLVVLLALGLPVALFLAWAFELTPEGVKREREVDRPG